MSREEAKHFRPDPRLTDEESSSKDDFRPKYTFGHLVPAGKLLQISLLHLNLTDSACEFILTSMHDLTQN